MQKARSCSHAGSEEVPLKDTKAFGDLVTMDHKVNIEKGEGCPVFNDEAGKDKHMLVILDYFTQWVQAYPVPSKDYEMCLEKILQFFGCGLEESAKVSFGEDAEDSLYLVNENLANEYKLDSKLLDEFLHPN